MSNETVTLIKPTLDLRDDFCSLAEEFFAEGDERYREATADFEEFVRLCFDEAVGRNLAPGRVPQSTFWLVRNEQRILACSRLRHTLNPYLEEFGGHVGYDVRPSERRRGYGTQILRLKSWAFKTRARFESGYISKENSRMFIAIHCCDENGRYDTS